MTKTEELARLDAIIEAQPADSYLRDIIGGLREQIEDAIRNDFCFADFRSLRRDLLQERAQLDQLRAELRETQEELRSAKYTLSNVRGQLSQIREDAEHAARRVAAYR